MKHSDDHCRPAEVLIDAAALRHNLQQVRARCAGTPVMAVIKADAYGHGMDFAAEVLSDADEFGVSSMDDVHRLRHNNIDTPCTVLSANFDAEQLQQMRDLEVRPVIYEHSQIGLLENLPDSRAVSVWLKVDTGMGRLGFSLEQADSVLHRLNQASGVDQVGLMTHYANADRLNHPGTEIQLELFVALREELQFSEASIANSGGILAAAGIDCRVRPGVMLYGISPILNQPAQEFSLKPVMTFRSQLISIRDLPAGAAIGYGGSHVLSSDTRIGIIACGYGDGYPRHAASGTPVLVNGQEVELIGRVSMDMITVDLGQVDAAIGDTVVLWGADLPVETIAHSAGTIAYELCCGITSRVQRSHINL